MERKKFILLLGLLTIVCLILLIYCNQRSGAARSSSIERKGSMLSRRNDVIQQEVKRIWE